MKFCTVYPFLSFLLLSSLLVEGIAHPVAEDSLLFNIQTKIDGALADCFKNNSGASLSALKEKLSGISNISKYWKAYTYYYEAIFYLRGEDKKIAPKKLEAGIAILEKMPDKNSDDYALLSLMQGFSIQFAGEMAATISSQARKNVDKAIKLDKNNTRAWFVRGSQDYYTPKMYGGGEVAEESLKKAIELPDKNKNNPYLPTWGKSQAYGLLVSFYLTNKRLPEAKKVLAEGLKLFPNDYMLKKNEKKLSE